MRKLTTSLCLTLLVFLGVVGKSFALPQCPSSGVFHNCFGARTFEDGSTYVGEWRNDKFHGPGAVTLSNGYKYVGEFRDGKLHGQGTYTFPSGTEYVGEFKDGKFHGQGAYTYGPSSQWAGDKYVGEFRDDKFHGQGTYTYVDGGRYVGEFRDDKFHGQGTYTYADGTVEEGIWENGEFLYAKKLTTTTPEGDLSSATSVWSADFEKGWDAYEKGDYATALREWEPLAEQGDVSAQYNLGLMYHSGEGVPKDYKTAHKWFSFAAAEQGDAVAQYNLGQMYRNGQGVPRDYSTAFKWYSLAAEQGYVLAQGNLGALYAGGAGVLQDNVYAHMWFSIAASQGDEHAGKGGDIVAKSMTPSQIAEAQKLARECVKKSYKDC